MRTLGAVPLSSPLLSAVFERAGVGLCLVGPGGDVVRANAECLRATGLAEADAAGRDVAALFPEADVRSLHERARAGETLPLPRHARRVAGRETWWEGTIGPVPMPDGTGTLVTLRDVTAEVHEAEALRDADRRKDEFLAVLSHELRNPLAPVRNACALLERAPPGGEAAERARAVIARQVDHLARLVDDLLDVTRISRGKVRLQRAPTDLAEVARRSVEDHRALFASRRVALELVAPEPIWVDGDPVRLAQVAGNLLQNAWKFTAPGGHVWLRVGREAGRAVLRVRDDGAGISPELLGLLFRPFTQAERTLERSRGGLGLGLALVKGVVELHGGAVAAHSEGEGRGAELTVSLPEIAAPALLPSGRSAGGPSRRRRVLLVEDNADAAASLRDLLELRGHEVHVAADGPGGIDAARRVHPDLVLCDVGLPGVSGYEVARRLRGDPALAGVVLVALTGYASAEDAARARAAGFHHHLSKPTDLEAVTRLLEASGPAALERARADAVH